MTFFINPLTELGQLRQVLRFIGQNPTEAELQVKVDGFFILRISTFVNPITALPNENKRKMSSLKTNTK